MKNKMLISSFHCSNPGLERFGKVPPTPFENGEKTKKRGKCEGGSPLHWKRIVERLLCCVAIFLALTVFVCQFSFAVEETVNNEVEEFDFANGLLSRGMYDMAVDGYRDFLKKYPDSQYSETAKHRISEAYFLDGKYAEALGSIDEFVKLYSSSVLVHEAELRKGQILYLKNDYSRAKEIFSNIINSKDRIKSLIGEKETENIVAGARYYMGGVYFKQGKFEEARKVLETLLAESDDGEYAVFTYVSLGDVLTELKEHSKAAGIYDRAVSLADGDMVPSVIFRAAGAYYLSGDYNKAQLLYKKIIDQHPDSGDFDSAVLGLFSSLYRAQKHRDIDRYYKTLLPHVKSKEIKMQTLFLVGNSYFDQDRFFSAREVYSKMFKLQPDSEFGLKAKINKGWTLYRLEKFEECISGIETYLQKTSVSNDEALYIKAKALVGAKRVEEALDTYKTITEEYRESRFYVEALYELGWLYENLEQLEPAIKYNEMFIEAASQEKRVPELLFRIAQDNLGLRRPEISEKKLQELIDKFEGDPFVENAVHQLGMVYFDQGEYDESIKTYKKFLKDYPDSEAAGSAVYAIGSAYQKKNEWDRAIKTYSGLVTNVKGEFYARGIESIAYCYFRKGDNKKAAAKYYEFMNKVKDSKLPKEIYSWAADYYLNENQNKKSINVLEIYLEKYPKLAGSGEVLYRFAENYRLLKDFDKATEYFQQAVDSGVSSPYMERSYLGLGRVNLSLGNQEQAITFLAEALKGHSDNLTGALARFEIGNVKFQMNDFEAAAKHFMMVAILYDDEDLCSKALFQAGTSFEKTGAQEKAVSAFSELVERYPENKLAKKAANKIGG